MYKTAAREVLAPQSPILRRPIDAVNRYFDDGRTEERDAIAECLLYDYYKKVGSPQSTPQATRPQCMLDHAERPQRKPNEAIHQWQQTQYDIINPNQMEGGKLNDELSPSSIRQRIGIHYPKNNEASVTERVIKACYGGGAGYSMGLLRHIFAKYDPDHSGYITLAELDQGLRVCNLQLSLAELRQVGRELDRNLDGTISLTELNKMISGLAEREDDSLKSPVRERQQHKFDDDFNTTPKRRSRRKNRIHDWQQVDYDLINPNNYQYTEEKGVTKSEHSKDTKEILRRRLLDACFGGGAGVSLGLLRSIFNRFDPDQDGQITIIELAQALGLDHKDNAIQELFELLDTQGDGRVSLANLAKALGVQHKADTTLHHQTHQAQNEMPLFGAMPKQRTAAKRRIDIAAWQQCDFDILEHPSDDKNLIPHSPISKQPDTPRSRIRNQLRFVTYGGGAGASSGLLNFLFKKFDKDKNGTVDKCDLAAILGNQYGCKSQDLHSVLSQIDTDGDGRINLNELASAIAYSFVDTKQSRNNRRPTRLQADIRKKIADEITINQLRLLFSRIETYPGAGVPLTILAEHLKKFHIERADTDLAFLAQGAFADTSQNSRGALITFDEAAKLIYGVHL